MSDRVFGTPVVKSVGSSGQISLGKEYAGRTVVVEMPVEGVWIIKTAQIIPDAEAWLHEKDFKKRLQNALEWSSKNPPQASNPNDLKPAKLDVKRSSRSQQSKLSKVMA